MMLLEKGLYQLISFHVEANKIAAVIQINASHEIFDGHFPGQPVLPGVCMLQISQELIEKATASSLVMESTGQVKFLSMVVPQNAQEISIEISWKENLDMVSVLWKDADANAILKYTAGYKNMEKFM